MSIFKCNPSSLQEIIIVTCIYQYEASRDVEMKNYISAYYSQLSFEIELAPTRTQHS